MATVTTPGAVIDPATPFWDIGMSDITYRNGSFTGVFGLRSCARITVDTVQVGNTTNNEQCLIGATSGKQPSTDIVIRNVRFHDMDVTRPLVTPVQHHQALFVSCVEGLLLEGCTFERVYGNTADLFFTGFETTWTDRNGLPRGNATAVTVRNCHFLPPTNGQRTDAVQFNDTAGGFKDFLFEGNLFDGAQPNFGTLKKPVTNFVVGVNYGTTPNDFAITYAKSLGIQFLELPFRPAADWPGLFPAPPPPPGPTIEELEAHIAALNDELAADLAQIASLADRVDTLAAQNAALEAKIDQALTDLQGGA
jgi:hypothetical protein